MFQSVLFDLDGTLTDPKEGITKSVQFALHQQGIMESDLDKLEPFIGPPLKDSFMEYYGMTQEQALLAIEDYRKRFAPIGIFENKVYAGIPEMLEKLKKAGMRLAVASSKPEVFVNRILEHYNLAQYFDVVVGSNLDGTRTEKEAVVKEALRQLGNDKITCAMVGDRKFDVQGAREHGLTAVAVAYGYAVKGELEEAAPDYIAKNVKQLERFLLQDDKTGEKKEKKEVGYGSRTTSGKEQAFFLKMLDILNPVLSYCVAYYVCGFLFTLICLAIAGLGETTEAWIQQNQTFVTNLTRACSMLGGAGFLLPLFRREQGERMPETGVGNKIKKSRISYLRLGILAGSGALGMNILFFLLRLTENSASYEQTAQIQYQVPFLFGIIFYGLISPIAEELLFRGMIYNRMKQCVTVKTAIVVSSFLFGLYHGNAVQTLYGTLLGLVIVYCYEVTESLPAAVFVHGIANVTVFSCTYHPAVGEAIGTPVNCAVFLLVFLFTLLRIRNSNAQSV